MKTIIIDDELSGREILRKLLSTHCPTVEIIDVASNAEEALNLITVHKPELLFLDIQMPRTSGFELLNKIPSRNFEVIFVTAHDEFAIKAFRYSAIDYLMKPVKIEELKQAVTEAQKRIESKLSDKRIEFLLEKINKPKSASSGRIILPALNGFDIIETSSIIRCESEINYTRFYFADGKSTLVSKTMKEFELVLLDNDFFRIHRSHIINLKFVTKYIRGKGGEVVMSDGSILEVSREKKDEFIKLMNG